MNSVTPEGAALIKKYEGLRLTVYDDPVGIRTIGYGHVLTYSERYTGITEQEADALLEQDIAVRAEWIPHSIKAPLNDNQFSALVSLVFNVGVEPLSHTLGLFLNQCDYEGASEQFSRWAYAGGKKLPGLVARREAERELFLKPIEEQLPWLSTPPKIQ